MTLVLTACGQNKEEMDYRLRIHATASSSGFWGRLFKCCGIGNGSQEGGMFASGKCQCALYYSVRIIEIIDGFRF